MFSFKCFFLMTACFVLTAIAIPIEFDDLHLYKSQQLTEPHLIRHVRSPEGGSVDINLKKDQFGREASVNYNHNLFTSNDGRGSVDAYGQASRNFDYNRNDFSGGIRGSWKF